MDENDTLNKFQHGLITFFDQLINQFPEVGEIVMARIYIKDQCDISEMMDLFIHQLNRSDEKLRKMIKERNESFFLQNNIFDAFNKNNIVRFKKLWRSKLDSENKVVVWDWIDSFVKLADRYIKCKEKSFTKNVNIKNETKNNDIKNETKNNDIKKEDKAQTEVETNSKSEEEEDDEDDELINEVDTIICL